MLNCRSFGAILQGSPHSSIKAANLLHPPETKFGEGRGERGETRGGPRRWLTANMQVIDAAQFFPTTRTLSGRFNRKSNQDHKVTPRRERPHRPRREPDQRPAFTLIELLAVVTILTLLAAAGAWHLRLPLAGAKRQQTIEAIRFLDQQARLRARSGKPTSIVFDIDNQTATVQFDGRSIAPTSLASLPNPLQIVCIKPRLEGGLALPGSTLGTLPTYAIRTHSNPDQWMVILGLTGTVIENLERRSMQTLIKPSRRTSSGP